MKKILLLLATVLTSVGAWAQITSLSDLANTSSYTIKCVNRGFLYYDSTNGDYVTSSSHTDLVDATPTGAANELFAFLRTNKTAEGNYYLFSKSANKFVTYKGTGVALELTDAPEHAWTVAANGEYFTIKVPETQQTYINITNWQAQFGCKVTSTAPDEGNKMTIKEVGNAEDFDVALEKITKLETIVTLSYTITDAAGNVFEGTYKAPAETEPTFTGVAGYTLSDKKWDGNKFTATITFPFPVSEDVVIRSYQDNYTNVKLFWTSPNGTNIRAYKDRYPATSNYQSYLWQIIPAFSNGVFSFTIKNVETGKYVYTESDANAHAENTVVLAESATPFAVSANLEFVIPGTTQCLSIPTTSGETGKEQFLGTNNTHYGTKNTIYPPLFGVTVGDGGYATLYSPFACIVPENVTVYAVTSATSSKATLTEKEDISAAQGAIVAAEAGTYMFTFGEVTSDWSGNLLKGSATDTEVAGEGYVLASKDGVTGFYKALLNDGKFKNNAGKAYLPASAVPVGARFLSFDFGTETAIDELKGENGNVKTVIYDLAGRRVQGAQKGIFIVNGKKVIK